MWSWSDIGAWVGAGGTIFFGVVGILFWCLDRRRARRALKKERERADLEAQRAATSAARATELELELAYVQGRLQGAVRIAQRAGLEDLAELLGGRPRGGRRVVSAQDR